MKSLHEGNQPRFKERLLCEVGDRLVKMATDTTDCRFGILYEPDLPPEVVAEMLAMQ